MRRFTSWLLSAAAVSQVAAQGRICDADIIPMAANHFENPPPACAPGKYNGINVYPQGTPLRIQWVCTTSPVKLVIVQENAVNAVRTLVQNITTEKFFQWDGFPPQPLSNGATFFFGLYPLSGAVNTPLFFSDYINITGSNAVSSSSSAIASSSSSASASSSSSSAASSSISARASSTGNLQTTATAGAASTSGSTSSPSGTSDNKDTTSSSGKTIGIGVGVGVGVVVLALIGFGAFFMRRRNNKKKQLGAPAAVYGGHGGEAPMYQQGTGHAAYPNGYYDTSTKPELSSEYKPVGYSQQQNYPAELRSENKFTMPPQELPAEARR